MEQLTTVSFADVQSALDHYHDTPTLEQHQAQHWPAVVKATGRGTSIAVAVQQLLDQALTTLETDDPSAGELLRACYLRPCIEPTTQAESSSPHRCDDARDQRTHQAIDQLAVLITQLNQATTHYDQARRFAQERPVVGLDQHAYQLHRQLCDAQAAPIALIAGAEGLGKTTLARLVAAQCAHDAQFADVLWSDARQIECDSWAGYQRARPALNPHDVLLDLARELGIEGPNDFATLRREVQAHCTLQRYLIVIDNLETRADLFALEPLIELLVATSRLLIVIRDQPAGALATPWRHTLTQLEPLDAPSSAALVRAAALSAHAPLLAQASDAELAQLYATVGGHPLALWLIVGQASDRARPCLLDQWQAADRAPDKLYDDLYRQIWSRLSDEARTVLFAMHRCETGAERELLFELSALDQPTFQAALSELQARMLVSFDGRYTIHRLTYTFLRVVIAGWLAD